MQGGWRGTHSWSLKRLEHIQQSPCFGDQEELTHLKAGDPCTEVTRGDAEKKLRPSTADSMIALDSMDTGALLRTAEQNSVVIQSVFEEGC